MFPSALHLSISKISSVEALLTNGKRCAAVLPSAKSVLLSPRPNVFVDASSKWGIGIYIDGLWDAWRYRPDHPFTSADINWLEALAVEIGERAIQARGVQATIFSDNTGVIRAFNEKKSRSPLIESSVRRTHSLLQAKKTRVEFLHVPTKDNPADAYSRGKFGLPERRVVRPLNLPRELSSVVSRAVFW
ncbi:uncharacterized protein ARMOST_02581 [Armillaria ostoyae]|uniref:RNase H type-1 domain-containing protein n=1 Tax=Armillaria ostoyae TaxID=47428 RepID=A0A284QS37_ARMOS|nr:uncharacterized protein ARMOST_02581 [Armillaria ostoyae]